MFFSGDPSARKRVALGGRSTKERDRQKLLEQTRLERERRSWLRKQTSAAIKIQVAMSLWSLFLLIALTFCFDELRKCLESCGLSAPGFLSIERQ